MDPKMRAARCDNGSGMLMQRRRLKRKTWEEKFAREIYELEETSTVYVPIPSFDSPSLGSNSQRNRQTTSKYGDKENYSSGLVNCR